ncbi:uncharacterized protein LOC120013280 [Tripterygium wilfordii]|uniref:uncharacterized protein LOC120013280 n=1 Tax=Tripterygium wilfordii TaxID=458696 RepID=UPI0018F80D85|nr:uncharacterized protein LOC120013280 [Tripterygium wilfordii]
MRKYIANQSQRGGGEEGKKKKKDKQRPETENIFFKACISMASRRLFNSKSSNIYLSPESFDSLTTGSHVEFDEADLYNFNESLQLETKKSTPTSRSKKSLRKIDRPERDNTVTSASLPVNVPDWSKILKEDPPGNSQNIGSYDDNSDQDDRIPPHEYLARVRGASFSVHEGFGRTLKGRDLRCVRNAIWQKTGFED